MLISYQWLKEFVKVKARPQEVADQITLNLSEIESLEKKGNDTILEIENKGITHRPDCFSHLGIAREVAAYFKAEFPDPLKSLSRKKFNLGNNLVLEVEVKDPHLCPRYCTVALSNLKVKPAPKWIQTRLTNCGIRPINNVVDITNYVMLELGQPLHAFDYEKVGGQKIVVRRAKEGETIVTLDKTKCQLSKDILVIADAQKPIGLAGIMGGENTEVTPATKSIVLESANFEPRNNRASSKSLKLRTEASTRFEKGLNSNLPLPALNRAIVLLQEHAEAKVASRVIDIRNKVVTPRKIKVSLSWINKFLGLSLSPQEIRKILKALQLETKLRDGLLTVTVPTFRKDLTMEADIAEEVARIFGYDKIPATLPYEQVKPPVPNSGLAWRKKTKMFLKGTGFTEIFTHPFVGKKLLAKCQLANQPHLQLINPLTVEQEFMRRSLIPSMLEVVASNLKNYESFRIFEINRVFIPQDTKKPVEILYLTGTLVDDEYLGTKGIVEILFNELGIRNYVFGPHNLKGTSYDKILHPQRSAKITLQEKMVGVLGEINPLILREFNIKQRVLVFDLNFEEIVKYTKAVKKYSPLPKYPPIIEDLSFEVPPKTFVGEMMEATKKISNLIVDVELLDSYKNTRTFRITYQSPKRTLKSSEVKAIREKIIKRTESNFLAILKGK